MHDPKKSTNRLAYVGLFGFAVIFSALLASCDIGNRLSPVEPGDRRVAISLDASADGFDLGDSGRTVTASGSPTVSGYELKGSLSGGAQETLASFSSLSGASVELAVGTWDLTLTALNDDSAPFLRGSLSGVAITATSTALSFTLSPLSSGTGSVRVTVSWAGSGFTVARAAALFRAETVTPDLDIVDDSVVFSRDGVSAGTYQLSIFLNNSGDYSMTIVSEMVRVYPGMTSEKTITLTVGDFNTPPTAAPSDIGITPVLVPGSLSSARVSWKDNSSNESQFIVTLNGNPVAYPGGTTSVVLDNLSRDFANEISVYAYNAFGSSGTASVSYVAPSDYCTITFYDATGTTPLFQGYIDRGEPVGQEIPNAYGDDYAPRFFGWYTGLHGTGTKINADTVISADLDVYEHCLASVTLDPNGGVGDPVIASVPFGVGGNLPASPFTRANYALGGWSTTPGGTAVCADAGFFSPATVNDDVLYAVWVYTGATYASMTGGATDYLALVKMSDRVGVSGGYLLDKDGNAYEQRSSYDGGFLSTFTHSITPFAIARYEVTYELWHTVQTWALARGYAFENPGLPGNSGVAGSQPMTSTRYRPVTTISWRDGIVWCNAYTEWHNAQTGESLSCVYRADDGTVLRDSTDATWDAPGADRDAPGGIDNPVVEPSAKGYRLPSEGEWQFAAGCAGTYPWNYASGSMTHFKDVADAYSFVDGVWTAVANGVVDGKDANDAVAVYRTYYKTATTKATATGVIGPLAVGSKAANAFGLYDMSGNVAEFCEEWYRTDYPSGAQTNFRASRNGSSTLRVARGGSWNGTFPENLGNGVLGGVDTYAKANNAGFRVCRTE